MSTKNDDRIPVDSLIIRLSALIARDVFKCGDENGLPCTRIQFKLGDWPDGELDAGGLCEYALAKVIGASLRNRLADDEKSVTELFGFDPINHHNAAVCPYCTPPE